MMNKPDDLDMGGMGMYITGGEKGSNVNCITRLIIDARRSVFRIVTKWEGKMVLRSVPMEVHIKVRTMPLYWRKDRGHVWLVVTVTSLGNM